MNNQSATLESSEYLTRISMVSFLWDIGKQYRLLAKVSVPLRKHAHAIYRNF